jgi:FAD/FMN-containing dehydrogenase
MVVIDNVNDAGSVWTRRGFTSALGLLAAGSGLRLAIAGGDEIAPWRQNFAGRSVAQGEADYESWRNAMPWQMNAAPRYPHLIARPASVEGVVAAVNASRLNGMQVAIKSGGHNVSGAYLRDGGILLDLGELQACEVDPAAATAWVQPALWSHGFLQALEPHGLAFPVSHCATMPMGGYLLGGGVGYNHDNWGTMACHSILAAEVVLASGETVIASPDSHPDLFWAVRGAGTGFFGVVTRYKLQLYKAPAAVLESSYIFPLSQLTAATQMLQDWAASGPADVELMMLLAHNPMAPADASPTDRKMCIVRAVAYSTSIQAARNSLATLADHALTSAAVMKNELQATSLNRMQVESVNADMGLGFGRYAVDTVWTDRLPEVMAAISDHFSNSNSAKTHYVVSPKMNRQLPSNAAFSVIGDTFVGAYAMWDEAGDDSASAEWLSGASALIRPLATGQYINEVDAFRDPAAVRRCFGESAWSRLRLLKKRYDVANLFYDYPGWSRAEL